MAEPVTYELFRCAMRSACHLEMRDSYTPNDADWRDWREGRRFNPADRWHEFFNLIKETTERGVRLKAGAAAGLRFCSRHAGRGSWCV